MVVLEIGHGVFVVCVFIGRCRAVEVQEIHQPRVMWHPYRITPAVSASHTTGSAPQRPIKEMQKLKCWMCWAAQNGRSFWTACSGRPLPHYSWAWRASRLVEVRGDLRGSWARRVWCRAGCCLSHRVAFHIWCCEMPAGISGCGSLIHRNWRLDKLSSRRRLD